MQWQDAAGAVLAVGALGTAAFGVVEAFGKALVIGRWGLPFVGFTCAKVVIRQFHDALAFVHGDNYEKILAQQYRDGRANGRAPETIRQAVRLALPLMDRDRAVAIVDAVWGMGPIRSGELVDALQAEKTPGTRVAAKHSDAAALLAGRFALALDARVAGAFTIAEERYQALARLWAGAAAIALSLLFNLGMKDGYRDGEGGYPWLVALIIGLAAVPLAPVAKDLSSALTEALRAWKAVGAPARA
jgi:hypothetical protein